MNMHKKRMLAVTLLMIGMAGCAATGPAIDLPTVQLLGVEASEVSFKGQKFLLSFDVSNPNPFPLRIKSVRYRMQLAEQRFAGGEAACDFTIPGGGNSEFAISVKLDIRKSAARLAEVLRSGLREPVAYELNGRLAIDIPLVKPLPFSTSGVISIAAN